MSCIHCGCPNPGPRCPSCDSKDPYPKRVPRATRSNVRPVGTRKVSSYETFREACLKVIKRQELLKKQGGEKR